MCRVSRGNPLPLNGINSDILLLSVGFPRRDFVPARNDNEDDNGIRLFTKTLRAITRSVLYTIILFYFSGLPMPYFCAEAVPVRNFCISEASKIFTAPSPSTSATRYAVSLLSIEPYAG